MIHSQSTAKAGSSVAADRGRGGVSLAAACCKEGGIGSKLGNKASSSKYIPRGRPPRPPLLLYGALSSEYNSGFGKYTPRGDPLDPPSCYIELYLVYIIVESINKVYLIN